MAPTLVALWVWGFVTGVAMVNYGLAPWQALLMSFLIYAGSVQLTVAPLMAINAPLWIIFVAAMVVNLRFIIFGASLYPYFRQLSVFRRILAGYFLTDVGFVLFMNRFRKLQPGRTGIYYGYFMGASVALWVVWQCSTVLGVYVGSYIPASWSLEYAGILTLLAIVIPMVRNNAMLVTVIVAGTVAWVGQQLPLRLGLFLAIIAGVIAGVMAEKYAENKKKFKWRGKGS
ncbi:MAG: branched-chain amino acid ABC transporter permease [Alcaligenaceae bacterium]|nr:branched-chain amino acid ABC transporter permease [Alcaligenaceae bacterium]